MTNQKLSILSLYIVRLIVVYLGAVSSGGCTEPGDGASRPLPPMKFETRGDSFLTLEQDYAAKAEIVGRLDKVILADVVIEKVPLGVAIYKLQEYGTKARLKGV